MKSKLFVSFALFLGVLAACGPVLAHHGAGRRQARGIEQPGHVPVLEILPASNSRVAKTTHPLESGPRMWKWGGGCSPCT